MPTRRIWVWLLGSLLLDAAFRLPAAETNLVIPANAVAFEPDSIPVNVSVGVSLLRHRATKPVTAAQVAGCADFAGLLRVLTNAGRVEVIYRDRRDLLCQPAARARFRQLESRPAFFLGSGAPIPMTRNFGVELEADLRLLPAADPSAAPFLALAWSGSWTGSVQLFSSWETFAVRAFNLARTLPGITYERVEEDEDGFVNTGGGSDFGGLFRRKKKPAPAKPVPAPKTAKTGKTVAANLTTGTNAPTGEPDYFAVQQPERIPLAGNWLGPSGGLIVQRHPFTTGPEAGELFFVVTPRWPE